MSSKFNILDPNHLELAGNVNKLDFLAETHSKVKRTSVKSGFR